MNYCEEHGGQPAPQQQQSPFQWQQQTGSNTKKRAPRTFINSFHLCFVLNLLFLANSAAIQRTGEEL